MKNYTVIRVPSRIPHLQLALLHSDITTYTENEPVLFLHGSSFPSSLAFGFKMGGVSWMDDLTRRGYDVYALDFLGYGYSDRYPQMFTIDHVPVGRATEVYADVEKAVDFICQKTGKKKVHIIAHSWGGTVAAQYAVQFPQKLASLVLFATIFSPSITGSVSPVPQRSAYQVMTPEQRVEQMKSLTPPTQHCMLEPELFSTWKQQWLSSDSIRRTIPSDSVRFPSGPVSDIEQIKTGQLYYDPHLLKVPVLVIRGEWDQFPSSVQGGQLFEALDQCFPKKYVVLPKGTHVLHLEKGRWQLYEEVAIFLKSLERKEVVSKPMAVIFEIIPCQNHRQDYLDLAAQLKAELVHIKGFISIERFQSLSDPHKILSLSFWQSEEAIRQWRNMEHHRSAQAKGRTSLFKDYRIRVVQVVRDYGIWDRKEVPSDSAAFHSLT